MAAGVPIVPIILRNAEDIGARDAFFMRPGTVDVAVLPAISTDDWSEKTSKTASKPSATSTSQRWKTGRTAA